MSMSEEEYQQIKARVDGGENLVSAVHGNHAKRMQFFRLRDKREGVIRKKRGYPLRDSPESPQANLENGKDSKPVSDVIPSEITADLLLLEAKKALYRTMKQQSPMPAYINLVIQICKEELSCWKTGKGNKQGTSEYKEILEGLLSDGTPIFKLLERSSENGPAIKAN